MSKRFMSFLLFLALALPITANVYAASDRAVVVQEDSEKVTEEIKEGEQESSVSASKGQISNDDFDIKVVCGLNGCFKLGAPVPVAVYITSKKEDFEGTVRIIVPGNNDYERAPTAFEKSVMLSKGQQKIVTMSVNNETGSSNLCLQIDNAKGKTLINQRITMAGQSDMSVLAGVLTDDYTALNYLDKRTIERSGVESYQIQLVELDEESVPEQASGLEALSYLIINSYDTSKLSAEQISVIEGWVKRGGILVLGTGSDYQRTLSAIPEELAHVTVSGMAEGELCTKDDSGKEKAIDFDGNAGVLDLSVDDASKLNNIMTQKKLIWKRKVGTGSVVVTAFNLGMQPLSGWAGKEDMADLMLQDITDNAAFEKLDQINSMGDYMYSYNNIALQVLRDDKVVNTVLVIVLLVAFAVLLPVSYLILKKMDRRGLLWTLIPVEAVFFTVLILMATSNVRIRYPVESSISVFQQEGKEDSVKQTINMSILVPTLEKIDLKLAEGMSNLKNQAISNYYFENSNNLDYKEVIKEDAQGYTIGIKNNETFQSNYFSMENSEIQSVGSGIDTKLVRSITGISGSVTNNTGHDLKGVIVLSDYGAVGIGDLKDGETKEVREADNIFGMGISEGMYDELLYNIDIPGVDKSSEEAQKMMAMYSYVCGSMVQSSVGLGDNQSVFILGYMGEWASDYIMDENVEENNYAIYMVSDELSFKDYEDAKVVSLWDCATLNDGWDSYDGQLYEKEVIEEIDVRYDLGSVYAMICSRYAYNQYSYYNSDNTRIYAWNLETEDFDELFTKDDVEEFKDGCPYLDDKGIIKMKFTCQNPYDESVPSIMLVGGED